MSIQNKIEKCFKIFYFFELLYTLYYGVKNDNWDKLQDEEAMYAYVGTFNDNWVLNLTVIKNGINVKFFEMFFFRYKERLNEDNFVYFIILAYQL